MPNIPLRCRLGLHDHQTIQTETYANGGQYALRLPSTPAVRQCRRCGQAQTLEHHLTNLSPLRFVSTWTCAMSGTTSTDSVQNSPNLQIDPFWHPHLPDMMRRRRAP